MSERAEKRRPVLSIEEVAENTGRSASTVRWWIHVGLLQSVKLGRRRMIRRTDLAKFIGCEPSELRGLTCEVKAPTRSSGSPAMAASR